MGRLEKSYSRDYCGGALMLLLGLGVVMQGRTYELGGLSHMGPGFFPVSLGVILVLVGIGILWGAWQGSARIRAEMRTGEESEIQAVSESETLEPVAQWRGWACIVFGIIAFVVLARWGGLLPASFAVVFISALGDRENTVRSAVLLSLAMCVICVVVFWWALQLQLPLLRWGA